MTNETALRDALKEVAAMCLGPWSLEAIRQFALAAAHPQASPPPVQSERAGEPVGLREALGRIISLPTKEWSIDTAKSIARAALAHSQPDTQDHIAGKMVASLTSELATVKQRLESAEEENARLRMDRDRLDFLDRCNQRLNATYGTNYGWQLILNHNVNRLMLGHMDVDLHDSHGGKGKLPSCRAAIDAEMERLHSLQEQEKQNG